MRAAVLCMLLWGCTINHDIDGLSPQEQALLGCWKGMEDTTVVDYRFHTDRSLDFHKADGTIVQGTYTAAIGMMHFDFGEPIDHRIYLSAGSITYVDIPGELVRQTCD